MQTRTVTTVMMKISLMLQQAQDLQLTPVRSPTPPSPKPLKNWGVSPITPRLYRHGRPVPVAYNALNQSQVVPPAQPGGFVAFAHVFSSDVGRAAVDESAGGLSPRVEVSLPHVDSAPSAPILSC